MTAGGVLYILVYFLVLLALTKPLGLYMAHVFEGERTFLHPVLRPLERLTYRLCGVREDAEQRWTQYAGSILAFSLVSFLFVYFIQRLQGFLPFNPMGFSTGHATSNATPMTPDLAFGTAVSFMTNTNWQAYGGETTLSYFVQMLALTVQNFVSAAAGIALGIRPIPGFSPKKRKPPPIPSSEMQSLRNLIETSKRADARAEPGHFHPRTHPGVHQHRGQPRRRSRLEVHVRRIADVHRLGRFHAMG